MEATSTILGLVRECVPVTTAARSVGISYSTIRLWRTNAEEDPTGPHAEFIEALDEAIAAAEIAMVKTIHSAAFTDPNHAKWMLERRFQGRWGPSSKTKVEAKVEHSGAVDLTRLTEAEADALQALAARVSIG
jgi:hypothetical protein